MTDKVSKFKFKKQTALAGSSQNPITSYFSNGPQVKVIKNECSHQLLLLFLCPDMNYSFFRRCQRREHHRLPQVPH